MGWIKKWSESWEDVARNAGTITACFPDRTEEKLTQLAEIVKEKCGFQPNVRIKIDDGILIGYVEDESGTYDARIFNHKCFARLVINGA